MGVIDDRTANNVAYDNSVTGLGSGDVQSALDNVSSVVAAGPAGLSISSNTMAATTSATDVLLNAMTITPTKGGNYAVIFTSQMLSVSDVNISIYANGVQVASSLRTATGPSGSHKFTHVTSEKVTVAANQPIQVFWSTVGSATCYGRNMTAIKVT